MMWFPFFRSYNVRTGFFLFLCILTAQQMPCHAVLASHDEDQSEKDSHASSDLEDDEQKTKEALQLTSEQIAKASLSQEVRVLFAEREALSAKLKWITSRKAVQKVVNQIMEKKEQRDASEFKRNDDPLLRKEVLLKADITRKNSEIELYEAFLEKVQAEVNLAYQEWQLAEAQIEKVQSIVNIEHLKAQLNDSFVEGQNKEGDAPKIDGTSRRKMESHQKDGKKHSRNMTRRTADQVDKGRIESLIAEEQTHLEQIEQGLEEYRKRIADAEAAVAEKQSRIDTLDQKFQVVSTEYEKIRMEEGHREPHIRWAGPSGFAISFAFHSWPTHFLSAQDGLQAMSGGLGLEYVRFCKYKGRNICRLGVDFLLGGDPSEGSFLLAGLAHIEAGYPLKDKFVLGFGLHGGYLAALGGHRAGADPVTDPSALLGNRGYGLAGAHVFVRFRVSSLTDLSFYIGGSGLFGPDQSGSLFLGTRFTIALPKVEIDDKKTPAHSPQK